MKIALAQLNPTVGDITGNARLVVDASRRAAAAGAELLVTSEMVVSGYPPKDLLLRSGYRLAQHQANTPESAVLSMPLPEVHRQLGPYSVRTALLVLLGTPFVLSVDPMQRQVSYQTTSPAVPNMDASVAEAPGAGGAANGRTRSDR